MNSLESILTTRGWCVPWDGSVWEVGGLVRKEEMGEVRDAKKGIEEKVRFDFKFR